VADEEAVEDEVDVRLLVVVGELVPLLLSVALRLAVADAEAVCVELLVGLLVAVELEEAVSVDEEVDDAVADCAQNEEAQQTQRCVCASGSALVSATREAKGLGRGKHGRHLTDSGQDCNSIGAL
jgi:hypothetical protein